ncbi:MAG: hypothetical protein ABW318_18235 [Vicinamibacterales bacterium]
MNVFGKLRRIALVRDERIPIIEILRRTPLERLDKTVRALKQHRSGAEVRQAMLDLIAGAPLEHFGTLKAVFMAHCAEADQ